MLKSQEMRKLAPEMDPLRIGTGWKKESLLTLKNRSCTTQKLETESI